MSTYNNDDRAPATGIAGTVLGSIGTALGLGLFNGNGLSLGGNVAASSSNDKVCELREQVAILTSEKSTDAKLVEVYKTLAAYDKSQDAKVADLNARVLSMETAAPLKEQLIDQKIARVADTMNCCCNAANASIAALQKTVGEIGQYYVNASSVTPLPMQRYNSFTVPTTPTTAAPVTAAAA